ncbi:MAG: class I SAM-dependent methyltransferase [Deltaproteobacteria bacterium]|nr:class I SAM-dependent methyltransferase [Deltaproteobacteria bacterium]MBW1872632.1 class I SAM-dependent methyltransferase [Deltaproteobacteria bacterium]
MATCIKSDSLADKLFGLLSDEQGSLEERRKLAELMDLFARLPAPPDPFGLFPDYQVLKDKFIAATRGNDAERLEESFLSLYCHIHGHEAPYTQQERKRVDQVGGYWCHAGGLSPVLKAGPYIRPETVSADFGAGNGLQGMLFQKLYPHKLTIQFEISSRMVEAGKCLQEWLELPQDRVEWVVGDVLDASPEGIDFIYLYRPVKPVGEGRRFYVKFAAELEKSKKPVVIFSIADCLREFLSDHFEVFYSDGHLTCFQKKTATNSIKIL